MNLIEAIKDGMWFKRKSWGGILWLSFQDGQFFEGDRRKTFARHFPTREDFLADDWEIVTGEPDAAVTFTVTMRQFADAYAVIDYLKTMNDLTTGDLLQGLFQFLGHHYKDGLPEAKHKALIDDYMAKKKGECIKQ